MIFHLFCLFAISHAFFNISKNMADIYSTLEGDYTQCFRERAAFLESGEDPMTLPKAVIMRDKIKSCVHVGNELILMTKEHPLLSGTRISGILYKRAIDDMKKDVEKLEKFIKAGGSQQFEDFNLS